MTRDDIDATFARALELYAGGDRAGAVALTREILDGVPDHADALHLMCVAAMEQGDLGEARARLSAALAAAPETADFLNSLGNLARAEGDAAGAAEAYRRAIAADPGHRDAHYNLALVVEKSGELAEAETHLGRAVLLDPGFLLGHYARGRIALRDERFEDAEGHFNAVLDIDAAFADAHTGLGLALEKQQRIVDALSHFRRAAELDPGNADALMGLAKAYHVTGRICEAMAAFRRCLELDPDNQAAWDGYLFVMTFDGTVEFETHVAENRRWGGRIAARIGPVEPRFANPRDPERRLRLGYVAGEFFGHVSSYNFLPVLERHDRDAFEIACYATGGKTDAVTDRIRAGADLWRDLAGRNPGEIAEAIAADGVDILVAVTPFRAANRIVLAHRPAPVVVSYMNQVGTTGLDAVDYLIADGHLFPPGQADELFPEKIVRLTNFNTCGLPEEDVAVTPPPIAGSGIATYASMSANTKVGPGVVAVWSRILEAVPGSRLLLMNPELDDLTLRDRVVRLFGDHGVAADRLELIGRYGNRAEYLSVYNRVDIALDPFPFCGGMVTYDALYMSTPVVALEGDYGYRRMTTSLLTNAGLEELIADDVEGYVRLAVGLAEDPARIAGYKRDIRARCRTTIFDADTHVRELEAAYREMWRTYCAGN